MTAPIQMDNPPTKTASSWTVDKVALFQRLFAGREDIFPVRLENRKTVRSGYSSACANEWVKGICGKPQVKCGECPHQAFISVSETIDAHVDLVLADVEYRDSDRFSSAVAQVHMIVLGGGISPDGMC